MPRRYIQAASLFGLETPAVVGSTTTMSWATADWEPLVSGMGVSEIFCATVMRETMFDVELSGLRTWTGMLPIAATSAGEIGAVHAITEVHVVVRAVPATSKTEPGPGVELTKLLTSTRRVNPLTPPA